MRVEKVEKQPVARAGIRHRPESTPWIPFRKEKKKHCLKWVKGKLHEEYESFSALGME